MADVVEKMDLRSVSITDEKKAELRRLFPEVFTEDGRIDFDRLKLTLGESVDTGKERYGMVWPGKADCFKAIQQPSVATLLPARDESVNFDETKNIFIEGDNLEVLKLLQKSYFGKVKMIYIDPPYNTGNDFIYPDNYSESLDTYLRYTGQIDTEGRKFSTNTEADGRFHSKWLNMMYPRLFLARNLLHDDGVIFITIDDQELDNLKKLCNEIFGEENFVTCIAWQKKVSPANDAQWFSSDHDYILAFAKSKTSWHPQRLERNEQQTAYYKNPDNDPRGPWNSATYTCNKNRDERPNLYYPITNPNTQEVIYPKETAVWKYSKDVSGRHAKENRMFWGVDGKSSKPRLKVFLSEVAKVVPRSMWMYKDVGHTQEATAELAALIPDTGFETPKPTRLIGRMLELSTSPTPGDIILDFFGGSATTAQAVLNQNERDGGNRRFILVQLPEPTNLEAFPTIADIAKERVRRVIKELDGDDVGKLDLQGGKNTDRGFKVLKLHSSNFIPWDSAVTKDSEVVAKQLEMHVHHVAPNRSDEDILYEIILKSGYPLSTQVEKWTLGGKTAFSIDKGLMVVSLERNLTTDVIKAIADLNPAPERVVLLDEGFASNDQLKTNAVQTMKARNIVFHTV